MQLHPPTPPPHSARYTRGDVLTGFHQHDSAGMGWPRDNSFAGLIRPSQYATVCDLPRFAVHTLDRYDQN